MYRPSGIVFDVTNTRLYVTDTFHNRVRAINSTTGAFTVSFGAGGSGTNEFYHPAGIGIGIGVSSTTIAIADELNHRAVTYFTNSGSPTFLSLLPDPTLSFIRPHGIIYDVTESDSLIVTDSLRGLISQYDGNGTTFNQQFGTPGTDPAVATELFYPSSGKGILTGTGGPNTVFADTRNSTLKSVLSLGPVITNTTGTVAVGTGDGELYYPESATAAVDTAQYVLVANTLNNRVEVYSSAAAVLTSESPFNFGSP